jgi:hypothetical protein
VPDEPHANPTLTFSATVDAADRAAVENLFFFHPRQGELIEHIQTTVETAGLPEIVVRDGRLWIDVPASPVQCLFACNPEGAPLGIVLYDRPAPDLLRISHLAVHPDHVHGQESSLDLGLQIVGKVRELARSIKGVTRIQIPYRDRSFLRLRRPES